MVHCERRKDPLAQAVRVFAVQPLTASAVCGHSYGAAVFTERILEKLSPQRRREERNLLRVLLQASQGLQELCGLHRGLFMLSPGMIGFNREQEVKIWFHQDHSLPFPEFPFTPRASDHGQHLLLTNLLDVGRQCLAREEYSLQLSRDIAAHQSLNFTNFRRIIKAALTRKESAESVPCSEHSDIRSIASYHSQRDDVRMLQAFSFNPLRPRETQPEMGPITP